jgi:very-short-patch-repair endonuclease
MMSVKNNDSPRTSLIREKVTEKNDEITGRDDKTPSHDKGRAGEGFVFLPYNKKLVPLARQNRKIPTIAEFRIWNEVLRQRQFTRLKFLRQKPIDNFIVDFYCSELALVIEIDGDNHAETVEYDRERTYVLSSYGLTVVRYTNDEVLQNIAGIYEDLSIKVQEIRLLKGHAD